MTGQLSLLDLVTPSGLDDVLLTYEDVATVLGVSYGAVTNRVYQGALVAVGPPRSHTRRGVMSTEVERVLEASVRPRVCEKHGEEMRRVFRPDGRSNGWACRSCHREWQRRKKGITEERAAEDAAMRRGEAPVCKKHGEVKTMMFFQGRRHGWKCASCDAERGRAYRAAHPDQCVAARERRIAREAGAAGADYTTAEKIAARFEFYGNRCFYCLAEGPLHIEHVKPLSAGGSHFPANLVPACESCNCSKGAKLLPDWARFVLMRRVEAKLAELERPGRVLADSLVASSSWPSSKGVVRAGDDGVEPVQRTDEEAEDDGEGDDCAEAAHASTVASSC